MPSNTYQVGGKCSAFLDGVKMLTGTIRFDSRGAAASYKTMDGVFGADCTPDETVSIATPVFETSPLEVVALAQRLTGRSGLLTVQDLANGTIRTANVKVNNNSESFDPSKAAEQNWDLLVVGEKVKV